MEVSVACAQWIPAGTRTLTEAVDNAETCTAWHNTMTRTPQGTTAIHAEHLLEWFDKAKAIVSYGGSTFDMQVLRQHYGNDEQRWQSHMKKILDPLAIVQRVTGRRYRLSTLLKANGVIAKTGEGSDAPQWWQTGKLQQLEAYCARDTAALMELVMRSHICLPGLQSTKEISILELLQDNEPPTQTQQPCTTEENDDSDMEEINPPEGIHSKKKRTRNNSSYDETKRRKVRKQNTGKVIYLDQRNGQGTSKRRTILMGATALEKVVRGRYDWRDGDLGPNQGARRRYWHDTLDNG